jgi:hypothetical protein
MHYSGFLRLNIDEIDDEIDDVVSGFFGSSAAAGAEGAAARFEDPRRLRFVGLAGVAASAGTGVASSPLKDSR